MQMECVDIALPAYYRQWWQQPLVDYYDSLIANDPAVSAFGVKGGEFFVGVYDISMEEMFMTGFPIIGDDTYWNGELYSNNETFGYYWSPAINSVFNKSGRIVAACYQSRNINKSCEVAVDVTDVDYATFNITTTTSLSRGISAYLKSNSAGTWPGIEYILFSSHSVTGGTDNGDNSYTITIPIISLHYDSTYFVRLMYETVADPIVYSDDFAGKDGDAPDAERWDIVSGSPTILHNTLEVTSSLEYLVEDYFTDDDPDGLPWDSGLTVGTVSEANGILTVSIVNGGSDFIVMPFVAPHQQYWYEAEARYLSAGLSLEGTETFVFMELYNGDKSYTQWKLGFSAADGQFKFSWRDDDDTLNVESFSYSFPSWDVWYTWRMFVRYASGPGANDGIVRMFDEQTLVFEKTDCDNYLNASDLLILRGGNVSCSGTTTAITWQLNYVKIWSEEIIEKIASKYSHTDDFKMFVEFSVRSEESSSYIAALEAYVDPTHRVLVAAGSQNGERKWIIMEQTGAEETWTVLSDGRGYTYGALYIERIGGQTRVCYSDGDPAWSPNWCEWINVTCTGTATSRIYVGGYNNELLSSTMTVLFDNYWDGKWMYKDGESQHLWSEEYKIVFSANGGTITPRTDWTRYIHSNTMYAAVSTDAGVTFRERVHLFDTIGENLLGMCEAADGAIWFAVVDRTLDVSQKLRVKVYRYIVGDSAVLIKTINVDFSNDNDGTSRSSGPTLTIRTDGEKIIVLHRGATEDTFQFHVSLDNGDTWEEKTLMSWYVYSQVQMVLAGGNILLYAPWASLFLSEDNGDTWTDISSVAFAGLGGYWGVAWLSSCGSTFIFSCCHLAVATNPKYIGFVMSKDAGTTWEFVECSSSVVT
jgi:hypothetical protein